MHSRVGYWGPPLLWAAVIFLASTDAFSAAHTGSVLEEIVTAIVGHRLAAEQFATLHFLVRKSAHFVEYGLLGALLFRAMREGRTGWNWRWAAGAIVIAAAVAASDEWHQTFVPSRTPSPIDVGIDTVGAAVAQLVIAVRQRMLFE